MPSASLPDMSDSRSYLAAGHGHSGRDTRPHRSAARGAPRFGVEYTRGAGQFRRIPRLAASVKPCPGAASRAERHPRSGGHGPVAPLERHPALDEVTTGKPGHSGSRAKTPPARCLGGGISRNFSTERHTALDEGMRGKAQARAQGVASRDPPPPTRPSARARAWTFTVGLVAMDAQALGKVRDRGPPRRVPARV